jgi:hypothetical protein
VLPLSQYHQIIKVFARHDLHTREISECALAYTRDIVLKCLTVVVARPGVYDNSGFFLSFHGARVEVQGAIHGAFSPSLI